MQRERVRYNAPINAELAKRNHNIKNRTLSPHNRGVLYGTVVTPPMKGDITHIVFVDKDEELYSMPASLFKCKIPNAKNTLVARLEEALEFGDDIVFTTLSDQDTLIHDYEKGINSYESDVRNGKYLIKTKVIIPPDEKMNKIYSPSFGLINIKRDTMTRIRKQAYPNVPILCWLQFVVESVTSVRIFWHSFIEVNDELDACIYDTPWNSYVNKKDVNWDDSDSATENDDIPLVQPELDPSEIQTNLWGLVIAPQEIFCPEKADLRFFIGLLKDEKDYNDHEHLGKRVRFKALTMAQKNIVFEYELKDYFCEVYWDQEKRIYLLESYLMFNININGFFGFDDYFGLVSDPKNVLNTLPYNPPLTNEDIRVYVRDKGPEAFIRFEIAYVPPRTMDLVKSADEYTMAGSLSSEGIVINNTCGRVHSHKYPTLQFYLDDETKDRFPVGHWIKFRAKYAVEFEMFMIEWADLDVEKMPLDCVLVGDHFEFKIDTEYHQKFKKMLYNPFVGFISDPQNKFVAPKNYRKFAIIVMEGGSDTLFMFERLAKPNEKLNKKPKMPISSRVPQKSCSRRDYEIDEEFFEWASSSRQTCVPGGYSSDSCEDEQEEITGLPGADRVAPDTNEQERRLTNARRNAKYAIRVRKLDARQRKRERERQAAAEAAAAAAAQLRIIDF